MSDELKDLRVVAMMSASELSAIDDWAFANRIRSRGEAIRRLCQAALAGFEFYEGLARDAAALAEKHAVAKLRLETNLQSQGVSSEVLDAVVDYSGRVSASLQHLRAQASALRELSAHAESSRLNTREAIGLAKQAVEDPSDHEWTPFGFPFWPD